MQPKLARKPSLDPVQEKLRQNKSDWNQSTSDLISELIALKRGLNGRGDPKEGLPPSSIKDPVPSEVVNYLNEVASQYGEVVGDAKNLIREQEEYSLHRRKPRERQQTNPFANMASQLTDDGLISLASNPFDRMYAKLTHWGKLNKSLRDNRFRMMDEAADFVRELRDLKNLIVEQSPESIPNSVTLFAKLGNQYTGVFLDYYNVLVNEYNLLNEASTPKPELIESEENSDMPTVEPEESLKKEVERAMPAVEEEKPQLPTEQEAEKSVSKDENILKYKFYLNEMHYADFVMHYIDALKNGSSSNKKAYKANLQKLSSIISTLYAIITQPDTDIGTYVFDEETLKKVFTGLESQYKIVLMLAIACTSIEAANFKDLAAKIKLSGTMKISSYISSLKNQEEMNKMAANTVSTWLKKQLMRINPNSQQRLLLDITKIIDLIIDELDRLMNLLQDKTSSIENIEDKVSITNKLFLDLTERIILAANNYISIIRRQEHSKNYYTVDVKPRDLMMLDAVRKKLDKKVNKPIPLKDLLKETGLSE